ncbi:uncharacterized protein SCHCODRAFT_02617182 [Schizophyllum commune H4-8]|nr:uncharacterized protein SCHCODRAFT_02617182 [Schizophyllum commune H4-8]KAI5894512.1 hypothetical protein SCHCODRAFT_02617182 [Schizophyllum commune H4-8]
MRAEDLLKQATSVANLDLQRNGFVPSTSEVQHIHELSHALSSELPTIDAEIERLDGLRKRVFTQLDVHKSITSPVRRLPLEILSEVFAILYDEEIESWDKAYITIYILSRVCSTWRALARGTPRLWLEIPTLVHTPRDTYHPHMHHLEDHISLSGSLPLRLSHHEPADDILLDRFLLKFRPHLPRLAYIDIDGSYYYFSVMRSLFNVPNLVEVMLVLHGAPHPVALDFLLDAKELETLELSHTNTDPENFARDIRLPALPTLTSLSLEFNALMSMDTLMGALYACCSGLEFLNLSLGFTRDACTFTRLELPALTSLRLADTGYTILEYLSTPSLEVLCISAAIEPFGVTATMESDGDPFPSLTAFVTRIPRPRKLKELRAGATTRSVDTFLGFLDNLDDLEVLLIGDRSYTGLFSKDLLTWLTCVDDQEPHLPHLKRLELYLRRRRDCRRK